MLCLAIRIDCDLYNVINILVKIVFGTVNEYNKNTFIFN